MVGDEERRKTLRTHRARIRAAIENAAENQEAAGVVTAWVCVAEVASMEDGEPCRTLFIDSSDHTDYGLTPWGLTGMMEHALRSIDQAQACADCPALGDGDEG